MRRSAVVLALASCDQKQSIRSDGDAVRHRGGAKATQRSKVWRLPCVSSALARQRLHGVCGMSEMPQARVSFVLLQSDESNDPLSPPAAGRSYGVRPCRPLTSRRRIAIFSRALRRRGAKDAQRGGPKPGRSGTPYVGPLLSQDPARHTQRAHAHALAASTPVDCQSRPTGVDSAHAAILAPAPLFAPPSSRSRCSLVSRARSVSTPRIESMCVWVAQRDDDEARSVSVTRGCSASSPDEAPGASNPRSRARSRACRARARHRPVSSAAARL